MVLDWDTAKTEISLGLDQYITELALKRGIGKSVLSGWKQYILNIVETKINTLKDRIKPNEIKPVLKDKNVKVTLNESQSKLCSCTY